MFTRIKTKTKVLSQEDTVRICELRSKQGETIILTNGCFDFLHPGHISMLESAASFGTLLVVLVNSDKSVQALKGKDRPIFPLDQRMLCLAAFSSVDIVCSFDTEEELASLIKAIKPHRLVKGWDYNKKTIVGEDMAEVLLVPFCVDVSSSSLIKKIKDI